MQNSNLLRSAIKQNMRRLGYNFSVLSEKSGVSRGALSLIFMGSTSRRSPMSFRQLTKITAALELQEGTFFDLYVDECFFDGRPSRSRIEPFLQRCLELGYPEYLEQVLDRLDGDPRYLPLIFRIAENGFKQKETKPLIGRLYEYLLLYYENRHSIEKAICHYRLFLLRLSEDEENNSRELNTFAPYRNNLPDELKMEALLVMGSLSYSRMDADELDNMAEELISLCLRLFGTKTQPPCRPFQPEYLLDQPIVFYYAQGYVMKQISLCEKSEFRKAEAYSQYYKDLQWLAGKNKKERETARKMFLFACANRLGCRLLDGEFEVLPAYIKLLEQHPKETVSGVIVLLKTANLFGCSIDETLKQFPLDLENVLKLQDNSHCKQVYRNRFARLLIHLSIYHFNHGRIEEALQAALQSWELSHRLNNHRMFRLLASLTLMYSEQSEPTDR